MKKLETFFNNLKGRKVLVATYNSRMQYITFGWLSRYKGGFIEFGRETVYDYEVLSYDYRHIGFGLTFVKIYLYNITSKRCIFKVGRNLIK